MTVYAAIAMVVAAWLLAYQTVHWREYRARGARLVARMLILSVFAALWPVLLAGGLYVALRRRREA